MYPRILHIYGPIWINSYGLMIAIGLLVFLYLMSRDKRTDQLLKTVTLSDVLLVGIVSGIVGGRILYAWMTPEAFSHNWIEVFYPWEGGLNLLGAIMAILIVGPWYLKRNNVPVFAFFDLAALYAPLLQSISRLGCFFAGCCHGCMVDPCFPLAISYTHPASLAPLGVCLHPTQLYSSIASLSIFLLLYYVVQYRIKKPGQLLCVYLMLECAARFMVDFWRGERFLDQSFLGIRSIGQIISAYQIIAIIIALFALIGFFMLQSNKNAD